MSPISQDPAARKRQIANLRRGGPALPGVPSNRLAHGGRSELLFRDVEVEIRELMDALGESVSLRENGNVPEADLVAIEKCARALKRYRHLSAHCDVYGRIDPKTHEVRSAARYELEAERALSSALDDLGLSPVSRTRLALDLQKLGLSRTGEDPTAELLAAMKADRTDD